MFNIASLVSVKVAVILMLLVTGLETAPTETGFLKPPLPHLSLSHASIVPEVSSAQNPSQYLKNWLLSTRAAEVDGPTRTMERSTAGRMRSNPGFASLGKQAQILKMITAMEELQRTLNSTLNSRITIMPRANGRNAGRKNKVLPAANGRVKHTTVAPSVINSTASKSSADIVVPSLPGRNLKKSLPPQTKKTKRVCFWKYCSQN